MGFSEDQELNNFTLKRAHVAASQRNTRLTISRFAELIEVPRRTYTYRLAKHRAGDPEKGPWPAPVVDRIEPLVDKYAQDWPAWGHRKIRAIAAADGHDVGSEASVVPRREQERTLQIPFRNSLSVELVTQRKQSM